MERLITKNDPIRKHWQGFVSERSRYLSNLKSTRGARFKNEIPQHSIPWPVDMINPLAHVTAYYDDLWKTG